MLSQDKLSTQDLISQGLSVGLLWQDRQVVLPTPAPRQSLFVPQSVSNDTVTAPASEVSTPVALMEKPSESELEATIKRIFSGQYNSPLEAHFLGLHYETLSEQIEQFGKRNNNSLLQSSAYWNLDNKDKQAVFDSVYPELAGSPAPGTTPYVANNAVIHFVVKSISDTGRAVDRVVDSTKDWVKKLYEEQKQMSVFEKNLMFATGTLSGLLPSFVGELAPGEGSFAKERDWLYENSNVFATGYGLGRVTRDIFLYLAGLHYLKGLVATNTVIAAIDVADERYESYLLGKESPLFVSGTTDWLTRAALYNAFDYGVSYGGGLVGKAIKKPVQRMLTSSFMARHFPKISVSVAKSVAEEAAEQATKKAAKTAAKTAIKENVVYNKGLVAAADSMNKLAEIPSEVISAYSDDLARIMSSAWSKSGGKKITPEGLLSLFNENPAAYETLKTEIAKNEAFFSWLLNSKGAGLYFVQNADNAFLVDILSNQTERVAKKDILTFLNELNGDILKKLSVSFDNNPSVMAKNIINLISKKEYPSVRNKEFLGIISEHIHRNVSELGGNVERLAYLRELSQSLNNLYKKINKGRSKAAKQMAATIGESLEVVQNNLSSYIDILMKNVPLLPAPTSGSAILPSSVDGAVRRIILSIDDITRGSDFKRAVDALASQDTKKLAQYWAGKQTKAAIKQTEEEIGILKTFIQERLLRGKAGDAATEAFTKLAYSLPPDKLDKAAAIIYAHSSGVLTAVAEHAINSGDNAFLDIVLNQAREVLKKQDNNILFLLKQVQSGNPFAIVKASDNILANPAFASNPIMPVPEQLFTDQAAIKEAVEQLFANMDSTQREALENEAKRIFSKPEIILDDKLVPTDVAVKSAVPDEAAAKPKVLDEKTKESIEKIDALIEKQQQIDSINHKRAMYGDDNPTPSAAEIEPKPKKRSVSKKDKTETGVVLEDTPVQTQRYKDLPKSLSDIYEKIDEKPNYEMIVGDDSGLFSEAGKTEKVWIVRNSMALREQPDGTFKIGALHSLDDAAAINLAGSMPFDITPEKVKSISYTFSTSLGDTTFDAQAVQNIVNVLDKMGIFDEGAIPLQSELIHAVAEKLPAGVDMASFLTAAGKSPDEMIKSVGVYIAERGGKEALAEMSFDELKNIAKMIGVKSRQKAGMDAKASLIKKIEKEAEAWKKTIQYNRYKHKGFVRIPTLDDFKKLKQEIETTIKQADGWLRRHNLHPDNINYFGNIESRALRDILRKLADWANGNSEILTNSIEVFAKKTKQALKEEGRRLKKDDILDILMRFEEGGSPNGKAEKLIFDTFQEAIDRWETVSATKRAYLSEQESIIKQMMKSAKNVGDMERYAKLENLLDNVKSSRFLPHREVTEAALKGKGLDPRDVATLTKPDKYPRGLIFDEETLELKTLRYYYNKGVINSNDINMFRMLANIDQSRLNTEVNKAITDILKSYKMIFHKSEKNEAAAFAGKLFEAVDLEQFGVYLHGNEDVLFTPEAIRILRVFRNEITTNTNLIKETLGEMKEAQFFQPHVMALMDTIASVLHFQVPAWYKVHKVPAYILQSAEDVLKKTKMWRECAKRNLFDKTSMSTVRTKLNLLEDMITSKDGVEGIVNAANKLFSSAANRDIFVFDKNMPISSIYKVIKNVVLYPFKVSGNLAWTLSDIVRVYNVRVNMSKGINFDGSINLARESLGAFNTLSRSVRNVLNYFLMVPNYMITSTRSVLATLASPLNLSNEKSMLMFKYKLLPMLTVPAFVGYGMMQMGWEPDIEDPNTIEALYSPYWSKKVLVNTPHGSEMRKVTISIPYLYNRLFNIFDMFTNENVEDITMQNRVLKNFGNLFQRELYPFLRMLINIDEQRVYDTSSFIDVVIKNTLPMYWIAMDKYRYPGKDRLRKEAIDNAFNGVENVFRLLGASVSMTNQDKIAISVRAIRKEFQSYILSQLIQYRRTGDVAYLNNIRTAQEQYIRAVETAKKILNSEDDGRVPFRVKVGD